MTLNQEHTLASSASDEVVIKVEHVSKKFSRSLKRSMIYGIKDITRNVFGLSSNSERLRKGEFWAVNDVSFEVRKGEALGIIGPNGAGKTTLLSLLNGIYMPDEGKITIKGKTGALIAVGAGFHPMLTGRENIYANGAVLGMSKDEIDEQFDSIIEFADIGDFIDMPVKNYSSGMFVRLGFAVAIHCEPDILLVDEILSVGDIEFRAKSQRKFHELLDGGTTVVFVSHSIEAVRRICNKVLLLNNGEVTDFGDVETVVSNYVLLMNKEKLKSIKRKENDLFGQSKKGTRQIELFNCKVYEEGGNPERNELEFGKNIVVEFEYKCYEEIENPEFRIGINSAFDGKRIANLSSLSKPSNLPTSFSGNGKIRFTITNNNLHHGIYLIDIGVTPSRAPLAHLFYFSNCQRFIIKDMKPLVSYQYFKNLLIDFDFAVEKMD